MRFMDASLPGDTDDVPVTMAAQVQKVVDCYNAGATVLHAQVREADGKGSKRMFMLNEMLDRLCTAVPKMVLQMGSRAFSSSSTFSIFTFQLGDPS